jgi:hypothetical protein
MPGLGARALPRARLVSWGAAFVLSGQLGVACLTLEDTADGTATGGAGGSTGTGGGNVGDAPWGTGGADSGDAGAAGASGAGGSGGFVSAPCSSCADGSACECVPEAPQGWSHARIRDGKVSVCPGSGGKPPVSVGTSATDTGCGSCQCGSATGGDCGFAAVWYSNASCTTTGYYAGVHTDVGKCVTYGKNAGVQVKAYGVGGFCGPGTATPKPPAFGTITSVCPQAGGDACGTNGACVAAAPTSFQQKACVMFDSQGVDVACPAGYPDKLSFSTGFDDTRKCTCDCEASLYCSGGSIAFDCLAGGTQNQANQCKDATAGGDYKILAKPTLASNGCAPKGDPKPAGGTLVASGLRVVCCR